MTEQDSIQPDILLSDEQLLASAQHLMSETLGVLSKRKGLRISHFSMDEYVDVATSTTIDGEPVCEVTYLVGKDGSKTARRIVYFDRGKRNFELGFGDDKVIDPQTGSIKRAVRGLIRFGNESPNTMKAQNGIADKLARLQRAYA